MTEEVYSFPTTNGSRNTSSLIFIIMFFLGTVEVFVVPALDGQSHGHNDNIVCLNIPSPSTGRSRLLTETVRQPGSLS